MPVLLPVQTAFATSVYQEQNQDMDIAPNYTLQGMGGRPGGPMNAKCW